MSIKTYYKKIKNNSEKLNYSSEETQWAYTRYYDKSVEDWYRYTFGNIGALVEINEQSDLTQGKTVGYYIYLLLANII